MTKLSVWNPWGMHPRRKFFSEDDWDIVDYPSNQLDMYEEDDRIVLKIKAPGFTKENIDITVEDGSVCITGKVQEEKEEKDEKKKKYYVKEFESKSFTRRVDLPMKVMADQAEAKYKDGILKVILPKADEIKPKTISIKPEK
jgi:HSP20 family protein